MGKNSKFENWNFDAILKAKQDGATTEQLATAYNASSSTIKLVCKAYLAATEGDLEWFEKHCPNLNIKNWALQYYYPAEPTAIAPEAKDAPRMENFPNKERVDLIADINYLIGLLTGADPQDQSLAVNICREYLEDMYKHHYEMLFPNE